MSRFLETIAFIQGQPRHLEWHQQRVDQTFASLMPGYPPIPLGELLYELKIPPGEKIKCRILYDEQTVEIDFSLYNPSPVLTLQCVDVPDNYEYRYKYTDRILIESLLSNYTSADDILMVRGGWITDTSTANIAFRKADRWYTPLQPLLAGTTFKRLVANGILVPTPIHVNDIEKYDAWKRFNAMMDWEESDEVAVRGSVGR